jgi:hypothetical protein
MTQANLTLNNENYHSIEANRAYMSVSQYKDFMRCEAAAMGKLQGWREPDSNALLLGSYVHAYFEGVQDQFIAEHPELFRKDGKLKAEFENANRMINVIESDDFCMFVLQGDKEVIMTAPFAGAQWKIKIDAYNPGQLRIADLKTTASIREKCWDSRFGYVTFVEAYGYVLQMAMYCEIEKRYTGREEWLEPLLVAVSKEDPPDKAIISFDYHRMMLELQEVQENMPRILAVKSGREEPKRCEKCRYCRETKRIERVVHFSDLLAQ